MKVKGLIAFHRFFPRVTNFIERYNERGWNKWTQIDAQTL